MATQPQAGGLKKVPTIRVIPGKVGQPYVPPTPDIPARSSSVVTTVTKCVRVV